MDNITTSVHKVKKNDASPSSAMKRLHAESSHSLTQLCNYADMSYWDSRYAGQDQDPFFEWYLKYSDLRFVFDDNIQSKDDSILVLGCGNSNLSFDFIQDGYSYITNIDFSRIVIYQMEQKYPEMTWTQMNAMYMSFPDKEYEVAVDKGTLDCIFCNHGVEYLFKDVRIYINEVERILKDNGIWIVISHNSPEVLLKFFENDDTEDDNFMSFDLINVYLLYPDYEFDTDFSDSNNDHNGYYVYVCKKSLEKSEVKDKLLKEKEKICDRDVWKSSTKGKNVPKTEKIQ